MRVLVCRAREDADDTARHLAEAGHEPVIAPVLAIVPLPVVLPRTDIAALVLTSRHALRALSEDDVARHRHLPVFAVGGSTGSAARARGFGDVRIAMGDAAGLADLVRLTLPAGGRLTYLAGRVHKPALPDALRGLGHALDIVIGYDAAQADSWPEDVAERLRSGMIDACLHFSRRSATLSVAAARVGQAVRPFLALRHACLSADVAGPLVEAGAGDVVLAKRPSEESLLQAL